MTMEIVSQKLRRFSTPRGRKVDYSQTYLDEDPIFLFVRCNPEITLFYLFSIYERTSVISEIPNFCTFCTLHTVSVENFAKNWEVSSTKLSVVNHDFF